MSVKPGYETTEHWRSWRADVLGYALVLFGFLAALEGPLPWIGVSLCGLGVFLLAVSLAAYHLARGSEKAAAQRPRVISAPRG